MKMYLLMVDYGKSREAVCNPEHTRRDIVAEVRDIIAKGKNGVAFVKFIDGNFIEDVTEDIVTEAETDNGFGAGEEFSARLQAARFDHAHDLRKHSEAV